MVDHSADRFDRTDVRAVVGIGSGRAGGALARRGCPTPSPDPARSPSRSPPRAVNRPDLLQRPGHYPPPPGASDVLGLECSGTIAAVGEGVTGWSVGDECCALLAGGGYAERVVCPAGQVMPVPAGVSLEQAASLPEVVCTVWSNVFMIAGLQPGEWILVHGGAGGIGSMAIQLGRAARRAGDGHCRLGGEAGAVRRAGRRRSPSTTSSRTSWPR